MQSALVRCPCIDCGKITTDICRDSCTEYWEYLEQLELLQEEHHAKISKFKYTD
jgi:hypothetical protein